MLYLFLQVREQTVLLPLAAEKYSPETILVDKHMKHHALSVVGHNRHSETSTTLCVYPETNSTYWVCELCAHKITDLLRFSLEQLLDSGKLLNMCVLLNTLPLRVDLFLWLCIQQAHSLTLALVDIHTHLKQKKPRKYGRLISCVKDSGNGTSVPCL